LSFHLDRTGTSRGKWAIRSLEDIIAYIQQRMHIRDNPQDM